MFLSRTTEKSSLGNQMGTWDMLSPEPNVISQVLGVAGRQSWLPVSVFHNRCNDTYVSDAISSSIRTSKPRQEYRDHTSQKSSRVPLHVTFKSAVYYNELYHIKWAKITLTYHYWNNIVKFFLKDFINQREKSHAVGRSRLPIE